MSLTLGALLILFFLLPGLVFRKSFFVLPFDKRFAEVNTLSEIGIILIISVFVQWLGLVLVEWLYAVWYKECMDVLDFVQTYIFSKSTDAICLVKFDRIEIDSFVLYQLCLWGLAVLLGFLFNSIIRYFKLDRKYRILRFGNSWYYYFSGEALEFPDIGGNAGAIDYIFVDALVRSEGKDIIYIGILSEYDLSPNGGLKSFALKGAKRRNLGAASEYMSQEEKEGRTEEDILKEYYTIPSNLLVIPFNDNVVNINFRYYTDDQNDEGESDNSSSLERFIQIVSLAILIIGIAMLVVNARVYIRGLRSKAKEDEEQDSDPKEPIPGT